MTTPRTTHSQTLRRISTGFSLIEVLLAIFILGVGVISISALFPAGIAQQRLSMDEIMGPTVANNAISVLRNKLKPDDFGTIESFLTAASTYKPKTIPGDWPWLRPGMLIADDPTTPNFDERGVLDVFSAGAAANPKVATEFAPPANPAGFPFSSPPLYGIPYNTAKYFNTVTLVPIPPRVRITQGDRYFPMRSQSYPTVASDPSRPQYVWDCMFRRFDGKIYVAIFVYRVTQPGGGPASNYAVAPNTSNPRVPPMPVSLDLTANTVDDVCQNGRWSLGGPDGKYDVDLAGIADNAIIKGMRGGIPYNPADARHAWQEPRQWLLDQNINVHRVLSQARHNGDPGDYMEVELVRPITAVEARNPSPANPTGTPYYYTGTASTKYPGLAVNGVVTNLWYVPLTDSNGMTLTPVYLTVKEL